MKAVAVENLEPGMTLARTVTGEDFVVILSENTILTKHHIARLQNLDLPVVHIKDEFDLSKNFQQAAAVIKKDSAFVHDFDRVSKLAYKVFDEINDGKAAKETVSKLAAKILPMADNHASVNYLFDLSHLNTTLALHCERVAIFSGIIAKWMGFNWEEIRSIVTSAFLHDVGKKDFSQEMLGKTLIDLENESAINDYKRHCRKGYNILKNAGFEEPVPTIALEHHERMNGEGFPKNLKAEKIHPFARVVAVADAYDNLTSEREGFVKKTPFDAINFFVKEIYSSFDPAVCVPLLTRIKDSLIGSSVTLSNGQTGHIAFFPKDFSSLPTVVTDKQEEINLNLQKDLSISHYKTSRD